MPEVRASSPGRRLRDAIAAGRVMLPGVFNPLVARMAERAGFEAVYLSGAALSASLGLPDVGLVALPEFVDAARAITAATALPLICDADTGFGEALNAERTVRLFEAAGVAGVHLEDQQLPKRCGHLSGKQLVEPQEMAAKLRAASAAKRDPDFLLIARTDARGVNGFADAVKRAQIYREAGADAIFPEALESAEEFAAFAKEVPGPLLANMTEFGKSPLLGARQLEDFGYQLILFPVSALRIALRAVQSFFADLKRVGTQKDAVHRMLTRAELYELLGYTGYEERDRSYFGTARVLRLSTTCPVCGYELPFMPWHGDTASDEICVSCGMHFGYDDATPGGPEERKKIYAEWRKKWVDGGMPWKGTSQAAADWNPTDQLKRLGLIDQSRPGE